MYAEREPKYRNDAEPAPGDALNALACIVLVVGIMSAILTGFKNRAENATKAEQRVMTEEIIIP